MNFKKPPNTEKLEKPKVDNQEQNKKSYGN